MHEYDPNRAGLCKQVVGGVICHQPACTPAHIRFDKAAVEQEAARLQRCFDATN